MKPAARFAAFASVLAVVFTVAVVVGDAADRHVRTDEPSHADPPAGGGDDPHADEEAGGHGADAPAAGHGGGSSSGAAPVKGLAVSDRGLTLELADTELRAERHSSLRFRILLRDGSALTKYEVEHERRMHLIVVRRDGTGFQHLHPRLDGDGVWSSRIRLDQPGSYRVFADFKTGGSAVTLGADLAVDGAAAYRALPESEPLADAGDGYEVRLDTDVVRAGRAAVLAFTVHRDGRAVHTEPYLGAGGHLVALREGDLAYLHTHPVEAGHGDDAAAHDDAVPFETEFPSAGRYRLYFQFKAEGRVHTAEFTQEVAR